MSEIEKLSFIQDYFYDGKEFDREQKEIEEPPIAEDCNCKLIRHNQSFSIGGGSSSPLVDNSFSQIWDKNSKAWGATSYIGASKYMQLWSYGKRIHSKGASIGVSGDNVSALYHTLEYNWFCTGNSGYPTEECGLNCQQDVNYTAMYDSRLTTDVELPSCFMCGDKGTEATAEDAAVLVIADNKGRSQVIGAGQGMVSSSFSKINNPEFYIGLGVLAFNVGMGIVAFTVPGAQVLAPAVINGTTNTIKTLIKTPAKFVNGSGGTEDKSLNFISQKGIHSLKPNTPTFIRLYSFGNIRVSGFTSWNNTARILSNGSIAGVIQGGTQKEPVCCSDLLGNWVTTSVPNAPKPLSSVKQDVGNFLNLYGIPYNQTELGFYSKNNCKK